MIMYVNYRGIEGSMNDMEDEKQKVYCEYEKGFVNRELSCFMGKDEEGVENNCWERPVKCKACIYGKEKQN